MHQLGSHSSLCLSLTCRVRNVGCSQKVMTVSTQHGRGVGTARSMTGLLGFADLGLASHNYYEGLSS